MSVSGFSSARIVAPVPLSSDQYCPVLHCSALAGARCELSGLSGPTRNSKTCVKVSLSRVIKCNHRDLSSISQCNHFTRDPGRVTDTLILVSWSRDSISLLWQENRKINFKIFVRNVRFWVFKLKLWNAVMRRDYEMLMRNWPALCVAGVFCALSLQIYLENYLVRNFTTCLCVSTQSGGPGHSRVVNFWRWEPWPPWRSFTTSIELVCLFVINQRETETCKRRNIYTNSNGTILLNILQQWKRQKRGTLSCCKYSASSITIAADL